MLQKKKQDSEGNTIIIGDVMWKAGKVNTTDMWHVCDMEITQKKQVFWLPKSLREKETR